MLFQYPGSRKCNLVYLAELLQTLPQSFRYAFEFRHETWFVPEVYEVLKKYNVALVLSDSPVKKNEERTWPLVDVDTANFCFIRFHGSERMYASSYTADELEKYSELIKEKMNNGKDVFCYFNNDILGFATKNAQTLMQLTSLH